MKTLTLIAPHVSLLPSGGERDAVSQWPNLARMAGRGSVAKRVLAPRWDSLHTAILDSLGLSPVADRYPSAAVIRAGAGGDDTSGFWLRAQPIHFAAGLDRLTTVVLRGEQRMNAGERDALTPMFSEHLQSSGLELHRAADEEWLLLSLQPLQVQTVSPEFAASNPRAEILPRGSDAGPLRRLMTEMQMLLHEHPINAQRQARGRPVINALWIHGEGMLSDVTSASLPEGWGDDLYLRGIYRLHRQPVKAAPVDAETLLAQLQKPTVAVIDVTDLDALDSQWLAPLSQALRSGAISKLSLLLDEWNVSAERMAMFKFWRRDSSPTEWSTC